MQSPQNSFWRDPLFWPAFVIGGFFLSLTLWFGLGMDQSIFCYSVWVWKHYHLAPYVGTWDHTFPAIYFIHLLAMDLFGESILGFRVSDFMVQLSGLPMIFHLAKKVSGLSISGFLATVFYGIFYYSLDVQGTAERETFVFWIFLFCTVLAFSLDQRPWLRAALAGLLLGFAFQLKPTFGLAWPIFGVLFLVQGIRQNFKKNIAASAVFSACCCIPSVLIVSYFWHIGAIGELYQAAIWFNVNIYTKMVDPRMERLFFWRAAIPSIALKDFPLIFFPALFIIFMQFKKSWASDNRGLFWVLLTIMLACLAGYRIQGKYFPYQLAPFVGFMIIFAAWGYGRIFFLLREVTKTGFGKIAIGAGCLVLILLMVGNIQPRLRWFARNYCYRSLERAYTAGVGTKYDLEKISNYYAAARYIKSQLGPDDGLAVFGTYPFIPFFCKRKLPTRYPCVHHLMLMRRDGIVFPRQWELIHEYSSQTIAASPRFFIFADAFPSEQVVQFNLIERNAYRALVYQFPELYRFVMQNYYLKKRMDNIYIYEIKSPSMRTNSGAKTHAAK